MSSCSRISPVSPGPQCVELAEHGVDRIHRGVPGAGNLGLGLGVVAGHPLRERGAQDAGVAFEAAGRVADGAAPGRDPVVGQAHDRLVRG
jgi:hypothetical protein